MIKFNFNECVLLQFFNQYSQPEVEGKEIFSSLELLSRGAFTQTSTMVSTEYADSVYAVIK